MTIGPQPHIVTLQPKAGDRYFFNDPAQPTLTLPGRLWMAVRLRRIEL